MTPRQLPEILKEYKETAKLAQTNLDAVPAATRPGFAVAIRQAQERLPSLKAEYLARELKNSVAAFAVGDEAKQVKFADVSREVGGTITVDARAAYEKMAKKVEPSIGRSREFSMYQSSLLDQALKELAEDTGYTGKFETVKFRQLKIVNTHEELVDYIRELVFASNGVTPAIIAAQNTILTESLKNDFTGKVLAVVVVNSEPIDRQAIGSMFTKTAEARVDEVEEVDERFARTVFEGKPKEKPAAPAVQNGQSQ